jgi:hypothetical protein
MKWIAAPPELWTCCDYVAAGNAWSGDGHRTVAAIALKLLPPAKTAALNHFLQGSQIRENFIDAASYPHEVIRPADHSRAVALRKLGWHLV